ncbi:MAG TPA: hypothetical protein VFA20_14040 [Myxococcaceae bacterium]|nr:hypothetical protein [Myxococcaceae bacterium]
MGITIQIKGAKVTAGGSVQHVITDQERVCFGLDDASLKGAVGKHFGKEPNHAYLKSPTPWNDLYQRYHWPEVETVLVAQSAQMLEVGPPPPEMMVELSDLNQGTRLIGSRGALKARIVYAAYLIGATALHYLLPWKGHQFWALDIGQVMLAGGLQNHRIVTQDVTIPYASSAEPVARVA